MKNYFKFINKEKIYYNFEIQNKCKKNQFYSKNDIYLLCEEFEKENINCNFLKDVDPIELAAYLVPNFSKKEFMKYGNYISLLFLLNEFYINQEEYVIDSCDQIFDECLSILNGNNYNQEFLLTKYLYNLANGSSERFKSRLMEFFSKTKNEKITLQNNDFTNINSFIEQRKITSGAILVIELLFELLQESELLEKNNKVKKIYNLAVDTVWQLNDIFLFQDEKTKPNILNFEFEKEDKNNILQSRIDILTRSIKKNLKDFLELTKKYYGENLEPIKYLEELVVGYLYFQLESGRYGILNTHDYHQQIVNEIADYLVFYGATPTNPIFTIPLHFEQSCDNDFFPFHIKINPLNWRMYDFPLSSPIAFSYMVIQGKTTGELKSGAYFNWFFSHYHLCLKNKENKEQNKEKKEQNKNSTCFNTSDLLNIKTIESIIIQSLKPLRKEINRNKYYQLKEKITLAFYRFIISKFMLKYFGKNSKLLNLVATAFENGEDIYLTISSEFNNIQPDKIDPFISSILILCGRENDLLFNFNEEIETDSMTWNRNNIYHENFLCDTQILYEDQMLYIRNIKKRKDINYYQIKDYLHFLSRWNEQLREYREKNNEIDKDSFFHKSNLMKKPLLVKNKDYYNNLKEIENAKRVVSKFRHLLKRDLEQGIENINSKTRFFNWIIQKLMLSEKTSSIISFDNKEISL